MKAAAPRRITRHRCFNHAHREAVAHCVACSRAYCRECVAEHDGRMICATCLRREAERPARATGRVLLQRAGRWSMTALAVLVAWGVFHGIARVLLELPSPFHEGEMWAEPWLDPDQP